MLYYLYAGPFINKFWLVVCAPLNLFDMAML